MERQSSDRLVRLVRLHPLERCFFFAGNVLLDQTVSFPITVEPRFNEPLFNEVLDITNDILMSQPNYSKMYEMEPRYNEPRYNEFFDIANINRKRKRKIYLDITNYNVNTRQKI